MGTSESSEQQEGTTGAAEGETSVTNSSAPCVDSARGSTLIPERSPGREALNSVTEAPARGEENVGSSNKQDIPYRRVRKSKM